MEYEDITALIDRLARQARDDESAYRTASLDADELSLTAFAVSCAVVCRDRADELEDIASLYRVGARPFAHYLAPLARTWEWVKQAWRRPDDLAIVDACKRREDAAVAAYEAALGLPIPGNLRLVLQHHLNAVTQSQAGFRRIRQYLWRLANKGEPVTTQADFTPT